MRKEAEILSLPICRLRREGVTLVYVSHCLNEIEALCDWVTVLHNGRVVAMLEKTGAFAKAIAGLMN